MSAGRLAKNQAIIWVPQADLKRVFEPFFSTRQGHAGTGLGLSVTYGLASEMGGEITVSSEPGTGSRFDFSIKAEAVKGGRASDTNALRGKTVLVADDDADLLELLRLYLNSAGLQVKTCTDASGALEKIHNTVPDVALLDLHLASDDGVALAQRMREAGFDKPIVLLYRAALPFLAILLLSVLIITYWPWLSLVLVR